MIIISFEDWVEQQDDFALLSVYEACAVEGCSERARACLRVPPSLCGVMRGYRQAVEEDKAKLAKWRGQSEGGNA